MADCFEMVRVPRPPSAREPQGDKIMQEIRLVRANAAEYDSGALLRL